MLGVGEVGLGAGCARERRLPLAGAVGVGGGRAIATCVVRSSPKAKDMALCVLTWAKAGGLGLRLARQRTLVVLDSCPLVHRGWLEMQVWALPTVEALTQNQWLMSGYEWMEVSTLSTVVGVL